MKVNIDLTYFYHQLNEVYQPLINDDNRYEILFGGAGSGKSHFIAQKYLFRILKGFGYDATHRILALRKTQPAVRNSVFALFKHYIHEWNLEGLCKINKSDMTIRFHNGSEILCRGLDDVEKIKSIEGLTSIWMEEATEFSENDLKQLNLRLRGKKKAYFQITLSFNPTAKTSWIYKRFFEQGGLEPTGGETGEARIKKRGNVTALRTNHWDNRFLDDIYHKEIEDLKDIDAYYYAVYALGEWGVPKNLILSRWIIENCPKDPYHYDSVADGLDFGFNHYSAHLRIGMKDDELFIFQELYERELTNNDLIELLKKITFKPGEKTYADSAEPDRIEDIARAGIFIQGAKKGPGSVNHQITYLQSVKIHIDPSCVGTIKEIQGWKWKEDKDGNVLDVPVEKNDDAMAALRYGSEPFQRPISAFNYKSAKQKDEGAW